MYIASSYWVRGEHLKCKQSMRHDSVFYDVRLSYACFLPLSPVHPPLSGFLSPPWTFPQVFQLYLSPYLCGSLSRTLLWSFGLFLFQSYHSIKCCGMSKKMERRRPSVASDFVSSKSHTHTRFKFLQRVTCRRQLCMRWGGWWWGWRRRWWCDHQNYRYKWPIWLLPLCSTPSPEGFSHTGFQDVRGWGNL